MASDGMRGGMLTREFRVRLGVPGVLRWRACLWLCYSGSDRGLELLRARVLEGGAGAPFCGAVYSCAVWRIVFRDGSVGSTPRVTEVWVEVLFGEMVRERALLLMEGL
jgi:hypothetical protein